MATIWGRNKIWGGTFNTDVDVADNANNASQVPVSPFFNFKFSTIVDATLTRSKYLTTVIAQSLRATLHKEEDRATGSNIGVTGTGIESTQVVYTTPEQLPEVSKVVDDFTISAVEADGDLTATQDMFEISMVNTDRKNKSFNVSFSTFGIKWLLARTRQQTQLEELISAVTTTTITNAIRVGTITYTAHTTDDDASKNLIVDTRTLGKGSSGADLNDDKYENLWKHLYDKYPDAICTLNVARTTRDADWIANRTLTLPKIHGRVIVGKDGTQTEFDTIGEINSVDTKTHLLTGQESGVQTHAHTIGGTSGNLIQESGAFQVLNDEGGLSVQPVSITINNSGNINAVIAHNNLQPYVVLNAQITY